MKQSELEGPGAAVIPIEPDAAALEAFTERFDSSGGYLPVEAVPADVGGDLFTFGAASFIRLRRSEVENDVPTLCALDAQQSPRRARDCNSCLKLL